MVIIKWIVIMIMIGLFECQIPSFNCIGGVALENDGQCVTCQYAFVSTCRGNARQSCVATTNSSTFCGLTAGSTVCGTSTVDLSYYTAANFVAFQTARNNSYADCMAGLNYQTGACCKAPCVNTTCFCPQACNSADVSSTTLNVIETLAISQPCYSCCSRCYNKDFCNANSGLGKAFASASSSCCNNDYSLCVSAAASLSSFLF